MASTKLPQGEGSVIGPPPTDKALFLQVPLAWRSIYRRVWGTWTSNNCDAPQLLYQKATRGTPITFQEPPIAITNAYVPGGKNNNSELQLGIAWSGFHPWLFPPLEGSLVDWSPASLSPPIHFLWSHRSSCRAVSCHAPEVSTERGGGNLSAVQNNLTSCCKTVPKVNALLARGIGQQEGIGDRVQMTIWNHQGDLDSAFLDCS